MQEPIRYVVDDHDIILQVEGPWLEFATANQSFLPIDKVVGRWLFEFIVTQEVRKVYKSVFDAVRASHKPITIPFRCDSHEVMRFMSMHIEPAAEQKLVVTSTLDQVISRSKVLASEIMHMSMSYEHLFCSHCNKIYIARTNSWVEIDHAVRSGYVKQQLNVSCTLCEHCEEALTFIAESLYVS